MAKFEEKMFGLKTDSQGQIHQEFQEQFLEHMDSLYNLAYRMSQNRADAADLVQDTALRAYRFYHKFEKGTSFKNWSMTILRNIFINQYRKKKKEPNKVNYDDVEQYVGTPSLSGFEEEVFGEALQTALNELSEDLRTTVILFYVEGLAYKEIAQAMDCPMGTVMSRLYIARQTLKKKLTSLKQQEVFQKEDQ